MEKCHTDYGNKKNPNRTPDGVSNTHINGFKWIRQEKEAQNIRKYSADWRQQYWKAIGELQGSGAYDFKKYC